MATSALLYSGRPQGVAPTETGHRVITGDYPYVNDHPRTSQISTSSPFAKATWDGSEWSLTLPLFCLTSDFLKEYLITGVMRRDTKVVWVSWNNIA